MRPANPGGLDIAGESETAFETSAGQDTDSQLDLSKMPEDAGRAAPGGARSRPPRRGQEPSRRSRSAGRAAEGDRRPGSIVQLGAFQNMAQAERAWTALSARFSCRFAEQDDRAVLGRD